jgi:large conductance mechanosensitive channel
MAFVDDFKKFAFKGNVVDLAVGVIIGAAFGKIVSALVADLVMPVVGLILPSGDFLGAVLDFFVVALALFLIVSRIVKAAEERLAGPPAPVAPATRECPACCETVPARATRCKFCTSELKPA